MRAERRERMCVMSDKDRAEFEAWLDSTDYWLTSNPEEIKWHDEWMEDAWQAARAKDAERIAELEHEKELAIQRVGKALEWCSESESKREKADAELAEARVTDDEIIAQSLTFARSSWFRVTTTTMAYIEGAKWARGFVRVTDNADGRQV